MKTHYSYLSYVCLIACMILASCSVQKRQYRPGYDITWKKNRKSVEPLSFKSYQPAETSPQMAIAEVRLDTTGLTMSEPALHQKLRPVQPTPVQVQASPKFKLPEKVKYMTRGWLRSTTQSSDDDTRVNGFAIASLVLGILSLVAYYGAFVLGVLAIIFGLIALSRIRAGVGRGRAMAWAGLICGIVALAIIVTIVLVAAAV